MGLEQAFRHHIICVMLVLDCYALKRRTDGHLSAFLATGHISRIVKEVLGHLVVLVLGRRVGARLLGWIL